jgi:Tol biopolymer transport system component
MIGSRLAHYEIVAHLGSGGMGQVYHATDAKLGRSVAIKVLPDVVARDASRVARFEREARILASLNHPRIAAIYGLEVASERTFLIMELAPGETLSERIARGPIPVREALEIAVQIADALESAHDTGVMHRDLKPANVKVTPDGGVKLLDFGLAKAFAPDTSASPSDSPTLSAMATQAGIILGTASYMSPEQAKGREIDRRSDVFAFGCVLYEMLTGRRAFEGDTVSEILARVIEREPDWQKLPAALPARARELLERCLEKDAKKRWRDCGDIRLVLERALAEPASEARRELLSAPTSRLRRAWGLAALLGAGLAAALAVPYFRAVAEAPEMRVEISTPATTDPSALALSPDGRHLVFAASGDGAPRLWLRSLDRTEAEPLAGTEEARYPFWSPDSRSIAFFSSGGLMRIEIDGGLPRPLANAAPGAGGAWAPDGSILFAPTFGGPLFRVAADGGAAAAFTQLEPGQVAHRFPQFLPGGRQFLLYVLGAPDVQGVYLGSLDDPGALRRLVASDAFGVYVPPGWLLFVRQGALVARRFDPASGELIGDTRQVAEVVDVSDQSFGALSASADGLIAYRATGDTPTRLTWFDRSGAMLGTVGGPGEVNLLDPEISPDGGRVAVTRTEQGNTDVWLVEAMRSTRVTYDGAVDRFPIWSPDGGRLVFQSARQGPFDLYEQLVSGGSGSEVRILTSSLVKAPNDWSPDGRSLLFFEVRPESPDLWVLPMGDGTAGGSGRLAPAGEAKPFVLVDSPFPEVWGQFSPDGRWVAYQSTESGAWEIYVRPFSGPGRWTVSSGGGNYPRWAPGGTELYYVAPDGHLVAVPIAGNGTTLEVGAPVALFRPGILGGGANVVGRRHQYDVGLDGRFLVNVTTEAAASPITLILNWTPSTQ